MRAPVSSDVDDVDSGHVRACFRERDRHRLPKACPAPVDERAAAVQRKVAAITSAAARTHGAAGALLEGGER